MRLSASLKVLDFDRDEIDVAIRFGQSPTDGLFVKPLGSDWATPMVAPSLARKIRSPLDLKELVLLVDEVTERVDSAIGWNAWFAAAGIEKPQNPVASFNTPDLAVGAAIAGVGALMGRASLTESALRDGRLVMPFKTTLVSNSSYRVVCQSGNETRPHIGAFIEWIESEFRHIQTLETDRDFV